MSFLQQASRTILRVYPDSVQSGDVLGSAQMLGEGRFLQFPHPVTAVKLDATASRPGALVGVSIEGAARTEEQVIGPGQVAYFAEGARRFRVRNALRSLYDASQPLYTTSVDTRGHLAFLGGPAELVEPDANPVARGEAAVLLSQVMTAGNSTKAVAAAGLKGVRVSVVPLNNNAPPTFHFGMADLVLKLIPRVFPAYGWDAGSNQVAHQPTHVLGTLPRDDTPSLSGNWLPHRNHEQAIDYAQAAGESPLVAFDRLVGPGSLAFAFEVATLTGTGLTGILLNVEGY